MNDFNLLLCLWVAFAPLVGAFLGAYFKRRAEDIATNANFQNVLEQLKRQTAETENIKAAISDDVWDRQKQWEMKRDAVFESIRARGELEHALGDLHSIYSFGHSDEQNVKARRMDSTRCFVECMAKYQRATFVTDLVVGNELIKQLSAYFQQVGEIAGKIRNGNAECFKPEGQKALADRSNEILREARKELNIKDN